MTSFGTLFDNLWIAIVGLFSPLWALVAAILASIGGGQ